MGRIRESWQGELCNNETKYCRKLMQLLRQTCVTKQLLICDKIIYIFDGANDGLNDGLSDGLSDLVNDTVNDLVNQGRNHVCNKVVNCGKKSPLKTRNLGG